MNDTTAKAFPQISTRCCNHKRFSTASNLHYTILVETLADRYVASYAIVKL